MSKDSLGDRMKAYEARETDRRFMNFAPVVARMDGRGFSNWTKGLARPYDENLSNVMVEVTRKLVIETNARIGYTQSDEITLVFLIEDIKQDMMFNGKTQKLCSVLASLTTAFFITECLASGGELAERALKAPHFDGRVFQVPTMTEAANAVLWREKDACKNAVSMAARAHFPHSELQGKSGAEMQEMIFQKSGMNFNDYPAFFKRGTFLQARTQETGLPASAVEYLPEGSNGTMLRRSIEALEMPIFSKVTNREAVIFEGAEPTTESDDE